MAATAVGIVAFLIACYATFRAAIEAGRAEDSPTRFAWLALEFVVFFGALGLGFVAPLAIAGSNDMATVVVLTLLSDVVGFCIALVATYSEYAIRGRLSHFGEDVRSSLWIGRAGLSRPFGGKRRTR